MSHDSTSHNLSDAALAGGLVTAPAWAGWIGQLNQLLTTISLVVGLAFGLMRLWSLWRDLRKTKRR